MMSTEEKTAARTCRKCGNCCRVRGYVRLQDSEVDAIAGFLGLNVSEFTRAYTRVTHDRAGLSLVEQENGHCIFLDENGLCTVNPVKPAQCRNFPHMWSFAGYEKICAAAGGEGVRG